MTDRSQSREIGEILATYVEKRRSGMASNEILAALRSRVSQLSAPERARLAELVKEFEYKMINARNSRPSGDQRSTVTVPPAARPPPAPSVDLTKTQPSPPSRRSAATRAFIPPPDNVFSSVPPTYFGPHSRLYLHFQDTTDLLIVDPTREIVVGRATPDGPIKPDVDLTPYRGEELGVSRLHASIRRRDETLTISDMNSVNHTFINGQELYPQEVRVLRNGDEVQFGRLLTRIEFKNPIRRLDGQS